MKIGRDITIDYTLNRLTRLFNIKHGAIITSALLTNPIDIAISVIAVKLGVNKLLIMLVLAFLL